MADEELPVVTAMARHLSNSTLLGVDMDIARIIARWWHYFVTVAKSTVNRYLSFDGLERVRQAIVFRILPLDGECAGWLTWNCGSWGRSPNGWRRVQNFSPLRTVLEGRFMPSYNATRLSLPRSLNSNEFGQLPIGPNGNVLQDTGEPDGSWFPFHTPFGRMFRHSDAAGRGPKQWASTVRNINPNYPNRRFRVEALELNQLYKPGN